MASVGPLEPVLSLCLKGMQETREPNESIIEDVTSWYQPTPTSDNRWLSGTWYNWDLANSSVVEDLQTSATNVFVPRFLNPVPLLNFGWRYTASGANLDTTVSSNIIEASSLLSEYPVPSFPTVRRLRAQVQVLFREFEIKSGVATTLPLPIPPDPTRHSYTQVTCFLVAGRPQVEVDADPTGVRPVLKFLNDDQPLNELTQAFNDEAYSVTHKLPNLTDDPGNNHYRIVAAQTQTVCTRVKSNDRCYGLTVGAVSAVETLFVHQYKYWTTTDSCHFRFDIPMDFTDRYVPYDNQLSYNRCYRPVTEQLYIYTCIRHLDDRNDVFGSEEHIRAFPARVVHSVETQTVFDNIN